jgi:hypothetical protein
MHWYGEPVRDAWWNNEVIRLERSVGAVNEYARMLYTSLMSLEDCNWVQVPRMAIAHVKEALRLKGLVDAVPSQPPERLLLDHCSDARRPLTALLHLAFGSDRRAIPLRSVRGLRRWPSVPAPAIICGRSRELTHVDQLCRLSGWQQGR